jgi:hypothetical protein
MTRLWLRRSCDYLAGSPARAKGQTRKRIIATGLIWVPLVSNEV